MFGSERTPRYTLSVCIQIREWARGRKANEMLSPTFIEMLSVITAVAVVYSSSILVYTVVTPCMHACM